MIKYELHADKACVCFTSHITEDVGKHYLTSYLVDLKNHLLLKQTQFDHYILTITPNFFNMHEKNKTKGVCYVNQSLHMIYNVIALVHG